MRKIRDLNFQFVFSFSDNLHSSPPPPKPSRLPKEHSAPPLPPKKQRNFSFEELLDSTDSTMNVPSFNDEIDFKDTNFRMNTCNSFKMNSHNSNFEIYEYRCNSNEIDMISNRLTDVEIRLESTDIAVNSTMITESNTSSIMSRSTTHQQVFSEESVFDTSSEEHPPPLPVKMRSKKSEHHKSVYDNLDDSNRDSLDTKNSTTSSNSSLTSSLSARFEHQQNIMKSKYKSCIESSSAFSFDKNFGDENPPPLPPKQKKHSEYN